jgi:hypothetical protein
MLIEKAVTDPIITTPAPVSAGVTYDGTEINVPAFGQSSGKVFAPPFLIPNGTWTINYEVQTPGLVFESVTYHGDDYDPNYPDCDALPKGITINDNNVNPAEQTKWKTTIENQVTEVNMLGSTIRLKTPHSESSSADKRNHHVRHHYKGDPTITVVKDPIDG